MGSEGYITVVACLAVSVLLLLPVLAVYRRYSSNRKLRAMIYVFCLIWLARFTVGVYSRMESGLTVWETIFDSMIHALQTFSMDEDYTSYTVAGKEMLEASGYSVWAVVYGFIISALNLCAPVLGGALLLDILTGVFPHIRLYLMPFRHKFVFSELNEASVTLAEDIYREEHYRLILKLGRFEKRPALIFTDAYPNEESEASSELFERAKAIGAICVKADLTHMQMRRSRSVSYFIIDEDTKSNISTVSSLLQPAKDGRPLWPEGKEDAEPPTKIFVFAMDDADRIMVKNICERREEYASRVVVRTIRDYRNIAINLMHDVPLFLPLLSREETPKDLYVVILGSGQIAENAFLAVYWCGQISGVQLHIDVLSQNATDLKKRLQIKYPELLESCKADSELLRTHPFDPEKRKNAPYCMEPAFIDIEDAANRTEYSAEFLERMDYMIVALGSDERNLAVAGEMKLQLARSGLTSHRTRPQLIAPAIFDSKLAEAVQILEPGRGEPYLIPFATMEERFSCKNVLMADFTARALTNEGMYNKAHQLKAQKDEYTYWANLARTVHAPYKVFGLGLMEGVRLQDKENRFVFRIPDRLTKEQEEKIAWIEHRRWCAFMRTQGFVCPTKEQYDSFYQRSLDAGEYKVHKNIGLKLHPCLVESAQKRTALPDQKPFDREKYDYLDYVGMYDYEQELQATGGTWSAKGLQGKEYKQWDYRAYDAALQELLPCRADETV